MLGGARLCGVSNREASTGLACSFTIPNIVKGQGRAGRRGWSYKNYLDQPIIVCCLAGDETYWMSQVPYKAETQQLCFGPSATQSVIARLGPQRTMLN